MKKKFIFSEKHLLIFLIANFFPIVASAKDNPYREFLNKMPNVVCKKSFECEDPAVQKIEGCVTFLREAFKAVDTSKSTVTRKQANTCLKNIAKQSCGDIKKNIPPPGCDFMDKEDKKNR